MSTQGAPKSEDLRLLALYREELLDTEAEAVFDAFTEAAATICNTPISVISLIDGKRQWFKSAKGLAQGGETSREHAFCAHAIGTPEEILEIKDATQDKRFVNNPLVTAEPNIRFYAGVPVKSRDGHALGTLCVIDQTPRTLTQEQRGALQALGSGIEALLRSRTLFRDGARRLSRIYTETPALLYLMDSADAIIEVSDQWLQHFGYKRDAVLGHNAREFMTATAHRDFLKVREEFWINGGCHEYPTQFQNATGETVQVLMSSTIERDHNRNPIRIKCVITDITRQLLAQKALVGVTH